MSHYKTLLIEKRNGVGFLTLNRPHVLNAVNDEMHSELPIALKQLDDSEDVDIVVITGAGRAFCAGGDYNTFKSWIENGLPAFTKVRRKAIELIHTLLSMQKITIARINGDAVGLGATIALSCDFVIAYEGAKIGDPHVKAGLVAGDGGTPLWCLAAGLIKAREFLLTGRLISCREAEKLGLVTKAVPMNQLDAEVESIINEVRKLPLHAVRWTKELINQWVNLSITLLMPSGSALESLSMTAEDFKVAVQRFLSKKKG